MFCLQVICIIKSKFLHACLFTMLQKIYGSKNLNFSNFKYTKKSCCKLSKEFHNKMCHECIKPYIPFNSQLQYLAILSLKIKNSPNRFRQTYPTFQMKNLTSVVMWDLAAKIKNHTTHIDFQMYFSFKTL